MNIVDKFKSIKNKQYNTQEVYMYYAKTVLEIIRNDEKPTFYNFITKLVVNLEKNKNNKIKTRIFETEFQWHFTAEQIIMYAIIILYDLEYFTLYRFLNQFEKEMKLYSTYNCEKRVWQLLISNKLSFVKEV